MLEQFLDDFPQVEKAWVHQTAVVIGRVFLGQDVSVWPTAVIRGDVNTIHIGDRSNVQDATVIHVSHPSDYNPDGFKTVIGEDVTVGHSVVLHGCIIGDRVLVGMGAIILDGAVIEDDVMIGAHSLVPSNKTLESGYLYLGSPVKKIRKLTDSEKEFLPYSAKHYISLMNKHRAS